MSTIRAQTRQKLVRAIRDRYLAGSPSEKRRILDEFVALTGYHRKHAIRVLCAPSPGPASRLPRARVYDEAVREALVVVWEASNRICGKRLKPLLPVLVPALEHHGYLALDEEVRSRLLAASAATIDRLLAGKRAAAQGHRQKRRAQLHASRRVLVHTSADDTQPEPGYLEVDLVAHCGDNVAGSFAHTLVLADAATGWTECVALLAREATLVVAGFERLGTTMPFSLRGIAGDLGSDVIDDAVRAYAGEHQIEVTRSQPQPADDRAPVRQHNGWGVRRLVGQGRLEGLPAVETLERLYTALRLFVNFLQPSFQLAEKTRVGARVIKRYHAPATPCARLLASPSIDEAMKAKLRAVLVTLDPPRLLDEIRAAQRQLARLSAGGVHHVPRHRDADLDRFFRNLATAWKEGEVRPRHRVGPKSSRHWRTRVDPFDGVWQRVVTWLEAEPDRTAKDLLQRLRDEGLGDFPGGLRTLQRRIKEWRRASKPTRTA